MNVCILLEPSVLKALVNLTQVVFNRLMTGSFENSVKRKSGKNEVFFLHLLLRLESSHNFWFFTEESVNKKTSLEHLVLVEENRINAIVKNCSFRLLKVTYDQISVFNHVLI